MKALGLETWPKGWEIHHIDSDKTNNSLDNLAIVTRRGHQLLHSQKIQKLYAWEKREFGTSQLKEMLATLLKG
ncbi:MAG: HNH endonuclease signature motif containing protein [Phycisphaerae bacterium]